MGERWRIAGTPMPSGRRIYPEGMEPFICKLNEGHPKADKYARLISAAPDLLEALEDALKCFSIATDYSMSAAGATEFRCKMRKKARVAIAKAKGEGQ